MKNQKVHSNCAEPGILIFGPRLCEFPLNMLSAACWRIVSIICVLILDFSSSITHPEPKYISTTSSFTLRNSPSESKFSKVEHRTTIPVPRFGLESIHRVSNVLIATSSTPEPQLYPQYSLGTRKVHADLMKDISILHGQMARRSSDLEHVIYYVTIAGPFLSNNASILDQSFWNTPSQELPAQFWTSFPVDALNSVHALYRIPNTTMMTIEVVQKSTQEQLTEYIRDGMLQYNITGISHRFQLVAVHESGETRYSHPELERSCYGKPDESFCDTVAQEIFSDLHTACTIGELMSPCPALCGACDPCGAHTCLNGATCAPLKSDIEDSSGSGSGSDYESSDSPGMDFMDTRGDTAAYSCMCTEYYSGSRCQDRLPTCNTRVDPSVCELLVSAFGTVSNACDDDHIGKICPVMCDTCDPCEVHTCMNGATCIPVTANNYECVCTSEYTGTYCSSLISSSPTPAPTDSPSATCFGHLDSNLCTSSIAILYGSKEQACIDPGVRSICPAMCATCDPCDYHECANGGACISLQSDSMGSGSSDNYEDSSFAYEGDLYECQCPPEYTGSHCHDAITDTPTQHPTLSPSLPPSLLPTPGLLLDCFGKRDAPSCTVLQQIFGGTALACADSGVVEVCPAMCDACNACDGNDCANGATCLSKENFEVVGSDFSASGDSEVAADASWLDGAQYICLCTSGFVGPRCSDRLTSSPTVAPSTMPTGMPSDAPTDALATLCVDSTVCTTLLDIYASLLETMCSHDGVPELCPVTCNTCNPCDTNQCDNGAECVPISEIDVWSTLSTETNGIEVEGSDSYGCACRNGFSGPYCRDIHSTRMTTTTIHQRGTTIESTSIFTLPGTILSEEPETTTIVSTESAAVATSSSNTIWLTTEYPDATDVPAATTAYPTSTTTDDVQVDTTMPLQSASTIVMRSTTTTSTEAPSINACHDNECRNGALCIPVSSSMELLFDAENGWWEVSVDDEGSGVEELFIAGLLHAHEAYACACTSGYVGAHCDSHITSAPTSGPTAAPATPQVCNGNPDADVCAALRIHYTPAEVCAIGGAQELCPALCDTCTPCVGSRCAQGSTCTIVNGTGGYFCDCLPGFRGVHCDQVVASTAVTTSTTTTRVASTSTSTAVRCHGVPDDALCATLVEVLNTSAATICLLGGVPLLCPSMCNACESSSQQPSLTTLAVTATSLPTQEPTFAPTPTPTRLPTSTPSSTATPHSTTVVGVPTQSPLFRFTTVSPTDAPTPQQPSTTQTPTSTPTIPPSASNSPTDGPSTAMPSPLPTATPTPPLLSEAPTNHPQTNSPTPRATTILTTNPTIIVRSSTTTPLNGSENPLTTARTSRATSTEAAVLVTTSVTTKGQADDSDSSLQQTVTSTRQLSSSVYIGVAVAVLCLVLVCLLFGLVPKACMAPQRAVVHYAFCTAAALALFVLEGQQDVRPQYCKTYGMVLMCSLSNLLHLGCSDYATLQNGIRLTLPKICRGGI